MRSAPALIIAAASAAVRIPPAAFTRARFPTTRRSKATSSTVAPVGPNPVLVLTKSALAARHSSQASFFSSLVSNAVSRMTLRRAPAWWVTSTRELMSHSTSVRSPDLSEPIFKTMSSSSAPMRRASRASKRLTVVRVAPRGKPITVPTFTRVSRNSLEASARWQGFTITRANP